MPTYRPFDTRETRKAELKAARTGCTGKIELNEVPTRRPGGGTLKRSICA